MIISGFPHDYVIRRQFSYDNMALILVYFFFLSNSPLSVYGKIIKPVHCGQFSKLSILSNAETYNLYKIIKKSQNNMKLTIVIFFMKTKELVKKYKKFISYMVSLPWEEKDKYFLKYHASQSHF